MKTYIPDTHIICTLGPSSSSEKMIGEMFNEGMDVVRINFSHGNHASHKKYIDMVKRINKRDGAGIKMIADLAGARIRISGLPGNKPLNLVQGRKLLLSNSNKKVRKDCVKFDYPGDITDIHPAEYIYIDDGNLVLRVDNISEKYIGTTVVTGGVLKANKGINIPGGSLQFPLVTEKDKRDVAFAVKNEFDYIAQSFVRSSADVLKLRKILNGYNSVARIIAKIESQEGIDNIDSIIEAADMIMIARGDMGISLKVYKVPFVQKEIIQKCRECKKPSITATQMLESMTENFNPTRAEVSDIANAVIDGTDFVMLSGETAVGKHPARCVQMMDDILNYTERYLKGLHVA